VKILDLFCGAGGSAMGMKRAFAEYRKAMGIDWMKRGELSQAVPPAYSFFIMKQFLASWGRR